MGQSDSTLAAIEGFQVSRVLPNSPAHLSGLVPFFDIITAVDRLPLAAEKPDFFRTYMQKRVRQEVTLTVFNLRVRALRDVPLTPTDEWGGAGVLGCAVEWCAADRCLEATWHIVDATPGGPGARCADIVPVRDYIIGMQQPTEQAAAVFREGADFHARVDAWRALREAGRAPASLLLLLYDSVDNCVREVLVDMGNSTSLGLDVANGYLHLVPATPGSDRLPAVRKFFVPAPLPPAAAAPASAAAAAPSGEPAAPPRAEPAAAVSAAAAPPAPAPPVSAAPPGPVPTVVVSSSASAPLLFSQAPTMATPAAQPVPSAAVPPVVPFRVPAPLQFPTFPPPPSVAPK